jgi:hypothetical protein
MTHRFAASMALVSLVLASMAFAGAPALSASTIETRSHVAPVRHAGAQFRRERAFLSQPVPHSVYEREGLSRNPADCVVYGCIGNN